MGIKNLIGLIIFAAVFIALSFVSVFKGINGLINADYTEPSINAEEGKLCEVSIVAAEEVYTLDHTLINFIPTGTEHFYLCESEDGVVPLLVKASESWYKKNFDMYGFAERPMTITGEVKDFDYERRRYIEKINPKISITHYLSATYKTKYILEIVSVALNVAAAAVVLAAIKRGAGEKVGIALCAVAAAFTLFVLLCADTL